MDFNNLPTTTAEHMDRWEKSFSSNPKDLTPSLRLPDVRIRSLATNEPMLARSIRYREITRQENLRLPAWRRSALVGVGLQLHVSIRWPETAQNKPTRQQTESGPRHCAGFSSQRQTAKCAGEQAEQ